MLKNRTNLIKNDLIGRFATPARRYLKRLVMRLSSFLTNLDTTESGSERKRDDTLGNSALLPQDREGQKAFGVGTRAALSAVSFTKSD